MRTIERFGSGWLGSAAFALAILATVAVLALAVACGSLQGMTRLDSMEQEEFDSYAEFWGSRIQRMTEAALAEGNIDEAEALKVASAIDAVASGALSATISEAIALLEIPIRGWAAWVAWETIYELDRELLGWRAYQEKAARIGPLLAAVSAGIRRAAGGGT